MSISRRGFVRTTTSAAMALPFARLEFRQQAQPAINPTFTDIRRNVGHFTARGGTIGWLANKDAAIVVDTQYANTAPLFLQGFAEKTPRMIDVLFNTHHHPDHTGGNGVFKEKTKRIVAHVRVPELQKMVAAQQAQSQQGTPSPAPVVATATFETAWGEDAGDEHVTARHYGPAHTGGDAIVHFERAHVVHMGDLLFHEIHPRIDRPSGASIRNWIVALEKITKDMPRETIYIAGHARQGQAVTTDRTAVLRLRDYFDALLAFTQKAIAAGTSREALAKTETLPGFESFQAAPPALTLGGALGVAYDELTAKG